MMVVLEVHPYLSTITTTIFIITTIGSTTNATVIHLPSASLPDQRKHPTGSSLVWEGGPSHFVIISSSPSSSF